MYLAIVIGMVSAGITLAIGYAIGYFVCAGKYDALVTALEASPRKIFKLLHTLKRDSHG